MPRLDGGWNSDRELRTLPELLLDRADRSAEVEFLDFAGAGVTYGEFDELVTGLANGFAALGVRPGDTVASMLDNSLDCMLVWFAANAIGAIWVPIHTAFKGSYLSHQLNDSGARVCVLEGRFLDRLARVAGDLRSLEQVLHRGASGEVTLGGGLRLEPLDAHRDGPGGRPTSPHQPTDLTCLFYTGGTTGPSKGCMISQNYMVTAASRIVEKTGRRPGERIWNCMPMHHMNASGSVIASMLLGSSASIAERFSVSRFWDDVERSRAAHVNLLGMMVPLVAQAEATPAMERCFGQVRVVYAVPFDPKHVEVFRERFGVELCFYSNYGLTEAVPLTYSLPGDQVPGAAGRCSPDFDVRIFDDDDAELPANEIGEIVFRPLRRHVMFEGYWNRPEATTAALRNLWFHSGDLGCFDDDGFLYFKDRKKDYLRRGGENISSVEVETVISQHPDVAEVAVHAVPAELGEDDVKATIVLAGGGGLTEEALYRWCAERLPYYALPRYVEFRDHLPISPVGRILKYQLRDEARTASTWDRNESDVQVER